MNTYQIGSNPAIDRQTYQEQLDKINEEITLAEIAEKDARIEEIDIQTALTYGEFVLLNAARLWSEFTAAQKQRLQQVLFPNGLQYGDGTYRTPATGLLFYNLQDSSVKKGDLVAQARPAPRAQNSA